MKGMDWRRASRVAEDGPVGGLDNSFPGDKDVLAWGGPSGDGEELAK